MNEERLNKLKKEIVSLHESVSTLRQLFNSKKDGFTLDGRLVGDIGEVIAEELFQIELHKGVKNYYDAKTTYKPELNIQIKASFKKHLGYNHHPDYLIGIQLFENGNFKVIYNGPGKYIYETYRHRKNIGKKILSFPVDRLEEISSKIDDSERILLKDGLKEKLKCWGHD